jgi:hypothetical protein
MLAALAGARLRAGEGPGAAASIQRARRAAARVREPADNLAAHLALADALLRVGEFPDARAVLVDALSTVARAPEHRRALYYRQIAVAQCRAGDLTAAIASADRIEADLSRVRTYSAIAEARGNLAVAEVFDFSSTAQYELTGRGDLDLPRRLREASELSPEQIVSVMSDAARDVAAELARLRDKAAAWEAR